MKQKCLTIALAAALTLGLVPMAQAALLSSSSSTPSSDTSSSSLPSSSSTQAASSQASGSSSSSSSSSTSASSSSASSNTVIDLQTGNQETPQSWKITLAGTVVSNQGDSLAVYLSKPQNMKVETSDQAASLQVIPITEQTAAVGTTGSAVNMNAVLPGQRVQVTFTYYWRSGSPRTCQTQELLTVRLLDTVAQRKSTATVDSFDRDVLVGTVLTRENNQLEMYVECGRSLSGGTEYIITGTKRVPVPTGTSVVDASGKTIALSKIEPFQRVAVTVQEGSWASSYPPSMYTPTKVSKVQLLDDGAQLFSPNELASLETVSCTLLRVQKDANGGTQLVVQPAQGSRESKFASEYVVSGPADLGLVENVFGKDGKAISLGSLEAGAKLRIRYTGLTYGQNATAAIPWFQRIDVVD